MAAEDKTTALVGLALPPFVRFFPTDQELLTGFLSTKLGAGADGGKSWGDQYRGWAALIPTVDLYGDDAYPWRVCQQLAYPYGLGSTEFYCFTPRRKKHAKGDRNPDRTVCSSGTWSSNGSEDPIYHRGALVGRKVNLTFKMLPPGQSRYKKSEMVNTHWVMHEYRLEGPGFQEMVLCRVRNQKKERDEANIQKECDKAKNQKERDEANSRRTTPWWEQQLQVSVNGGDGDNTCSSGRKRKVAPLCNEDAGAPPQQQRKSEIIDTAPLRTPVIQMRQQCPDVLPAAPPAVLSPSAAIPPFSSTAASPNDQVGADQHNQLLALDNYTQKEEAASGADSRTVLPYDLQEHRDEYLCSNGATPLNSTDAPNDNLDVRDSEREIINSGSSVDGYTSDPQDVAAPREPAAAGLSSSTSTGGGAVDGTAGWMASMELLYWRDMAFDAGDPCWSQLLPTVGQQFVEEEEEEEAEFHLWDW